MQYESDNKTEEEPPINRLRKHKKRRQTGNRSLLKNDEFQHTNRETFCVTKTRKSTLLRNSSLNDGV